METLINPQFITDANGQKVGVYLLMDDFDKLLEELEDLEDVKSFDEAQKRTDRESVPFDQAIDEIRKSRPEQAK